MRCSRYTVVVSTAVSLMWPRLPLRRRRRRLDRLSSSLCSQGSRLFRAGTKAAHSTAVDLMKSSLEMLGMHKMSNGGVHQAVHA